MSRSLGDKIAHSVGVSSKPLISSFKFPEARSKKYYLVMGTDGLWEHLSNGEIMSLLKANHSKGLKKISEILEEEARARWKANDKIIDDITILINSFEN